MDRISLAHLPTPIEALARLSEHLGGPRLFVKRDDCTGLAFGGNKTRKLEYLMAEATAQGADTIITTGGVQSNHVRQTAAAAAKLGFRAELVLGRTVPISAGDYELTGNIQIDRLLGARIHYCGGDEDRTAIMEQVAEQVRARGERPYVIPSGGSNPTGALGYVDCVREIARQETQLEHGFDYLVHATGSAGTQAGLVAGVCDLGHPMQVIGIDIDAEPEVVECKVRALSEETLERLGGDRAMPGPAVRVEPGYAGEAYGLPTREGLAAITLLARLEGLLLDPVYTGKAMAGLIDLVGRGAFQASDNILFLHSGGSPALFAYRSWFDQAEGPAAAVP